jgi:hypothetical protein
VSGSSFVAKRRGRTGAGCLLLTALVIVGVYVGLTVGQIYFRYYRFEDEMKQSVRFAAQLSDSAIQNRIAVAADSLGLPAAAHNVNVMRVGRTISVSGSYSELVDLRVWKHYLHFSPSARATF